jgi:pimeloyl-ACP methyl ester carboxylesterase
LTYVTIPASVFRTAQGVKVHYVEAGDAGAPPIILIHGFASSTFTWKKIMPELAKSYHVFAIDVPGFGFSDKPEDFPYGGEGYGKTVLNFMDQKKIEKAIFVGNSMGGYISLWIAIHHPERITRLVLIDALGYPKESPGLIALASKGWLQPISKPFIGKPMLKMALKQVYYNDALVTPELVEEYGRPFKTPNAKAVPFWLFKNLSMEHVTEDAGKIPTIKIPTLIIWGENDAWIPPEHAKLFHRDIQGSKMIMLPQCGHVPQEEKPEVVLEAILEFLRKNP